MHFWDLRHLPCGWDHLPVPGVALHLLHLRETTITIGTSSQKGWPSLFLLQLMMEVCWLGGVEEARVAAARVVSTRWMRALRAVGLASFILNSKSRGINKVALAAFGVCSGSFSSMKILHVTLVLVLARRSTLCHHWPTSSHGRSLPLLAMMKSLPLWAIAVAYFCNDWLFYMLLTSMPTYMNEVLHFDIRENGLLSALPYMGNWLGTIVSGLLADFLLSKHMFSTATVRKLFSVLGMLLPAVSLVAVSYVGCDYTAAVVFLTLSVTVISMCGAGFNINQIDIAPRYAGFLLGVTNTFGTVSGIIAPSAVGFLTSQDLLTGWRNVFFVSAALNLFGLLFYVTFGSGTIQDWAREDTALQ